MVTQWLVLRAVSKRQAVVVAIADDEHSAIRKAYAHSVPLENILKLEATQEELAEVGSSVTLLRAADC